MRTRFGGVDVATAVDPRHLTVARAIDAQIRAADYPICSPVSQLLLTAAYPSHTPLLRVPELMLFFELLYERVQFTANEIRRGNFQHL